MGQGSEFIVRLPRDALVDADEPAVVQSPQRGASAGIKSRILVVDDNRDGADSLGLILQLWGHDVVVAYSGATGLELARRHRPEVAILDIGLTDITGYELARRIRLEDWGRDIVLIALTGWGHGADKARAAAAGFDVHLTKPVDPDHLQALLQDPRVS
jgi:CheY-like chemotaxis protein